MENEETEDFVVKNNSVHDNSSAVNKLILDYYKKFGRKRNIEQFFSLSTVDSSLGDTSGSFWKTMKEQNDSSDSTELCRISIKCSMQEPNNSVEKEKNTKSDVESPPIISEEVFAGCVISDYDCNKSDGGNSQKSIDVTLDTSMNRPPSPTSSVTSQRKLEWDPLADVGYPNESNRKNSALSLSTLERLALHQQYSNNDSIQNSNLDSPTAHSTPLEQTENKSKVKKNDIKKTTKYSKKDIDIMEVNFPSTSDTMPQPINVNLTKNISFNVEKDGNIRMDNMAKNVTVQQDKISVATEVTLPTNMDKEIQTTLLKSYPKEEASCHKQALPVYISLNTLKKRNKKKKCKRMLSRQRKKLADKENRPLERNVNQVSEAESFEYMPGHIYNQNKVENKNSMNIHDNKSSLGSSATHTTETNKVARTCTFSKELERSIDLLKLALKHRYEDTNLKKRLIKEVIERLIKTKYKGENSSTDYLSGLSHNNHTTSTSDSNNAGDKKPNKSILRAEKFNSNVIAASSQSVPNLPMVSNTEKKPLTDKVNLTSTDSDLSYKNKYLSEATLANSPSEQIYKKYLLALKKESIYKRQLTEKELFLNDVLKKSNVFSNSDLQDESKTKNSLSHLMKDLARNNYDDGSGDASKLEGASSSNIDLEINSLKKFRSHSVFTLSSGNSESQKKNKKLRNRLENEMNTSTDRSSSTKKSCSCSTSKHNKVEFTDSSIQVNLNRVNKQSPQDTTNKQSACSNSNSKKESDKLEVDSAKNIEYVCLCTEKAKDVPENFLIYRCSRLPNKCVMVGDGNMSDNIQEVQQLKDMKPILLHEMKLSNNSENKCLMSKENLSTQSSQTNFNLLKLLERNSCKKCLTLESSQEKCISQNKNSTKLSTVQRDKQINFICESTRWVQTEISIDPKISEPSMTDIRIIDEECYAGLVSEQERPISEFSSECEDVSEPKHQLQYKNCEIKLQPNKHLLKNSEACTTTPDLNNKINIGIQSCANEANNLTDAQNNFTIPIHGTNMTLNVSLGSGDKAPSRNVLRSVDTCARRRIPNQPEEMKVGKCVISENLTCVQQECSIGVQSENVDVLKDFTGKSEILNVNYDQNNKNNCCGEIKANRTPKPSYVYNCLSNDRKFNTYPKESILKKPLHRSNTTIGKMEYANPVTFKGTRGKDANTQYDSVLKQANQNNVKDTCHCSTSEGSSNTTNKKACEKINIFEKETSNPRPCSSNSNTSGDSKVNDPLLDIIQDITKRYSKKEFEKGKRKKCFKEIISVLNYLLDTESTDNDANKNNILLVNSSENEFDNPKKIQCRRNKSTKTLIDRGVQLPYKKTKEYKNCTESSDFPFSTDIPSTSTESATCKVLHKIRQECDDYHRKRCKSHNIKHEASSSTSINCDQCKHVHHCSCRSHKSHKARAAERSAKKCVAYNLIVQTSDSIGCEDENNEKCGRQLKNIIVKVPSKCRVKDMMFNEIAQKIEKSLPCSPEKIPLKKAAIYNRDCRSKSYHREKEASSTENIIGKSACTVKEYLEKNRPDFIEKSSKRQNCLKSISETRTIQRSAQRELLSLHVEGGRSVAASGEQELRRLAERLGAEMRRKTVAPKFISEKEMKKHSEKIYKSLPEVQRRQEEMKKDKIRKTNLLMANIFKKNLQKKTLRGAVNLSNYSAVVKI